AANAISASSLAARSGWSGRRQARNHRASSASVTSTGSRSTPTRATTSGIARVGMGRSPTTEAGICTQDDGAPSDCPLLYVMPERSTLRLSPAEQPTSSYRASNLGLTRSTDRRVLPGLAGAEVELLP